MNQPELPFPSEARNFTVRTEPPERRISQFDMDSVANILANGARLSMDEIADKLRAKRWTVNEILCNMGRQVEHAVVKQKGVKGTVTLYFLRKPRVTS